MTDLVGVKYLVITSDTHLAEGTDQNHLSRYWGSYMTDQVEVKYLVTTSVTHLAEWADQYHLSRYRGSYMTDQVEVKYSVITLILTWERGRPVRGRRMTDQVEVKYLVTTSDTHLAEGEDQYHLSRYRISYMTDQVEVRYVVTTSGTHLTEGVAASSRPHTLRTSRPQTGQPGRTGSRQAEPRLRSSPAASPSPPRRRWR